MAVVAAAFVLAGGALVILVPVLSVVVWRRAVAAFVIAAALGIFGLKRTRLAGWLLIAVGGFPLAISAFWGPVGGQPLVLVGVVPLITGTLYVISAGLVERGAGTPDPNRAPVVPVATGGKNDGAGN